MRLGRLEVLPLLPTLFWPGTKQRRAALQQAVVHYAAGCGSTSWQSAPLRQASFG